MTKNTPGGATRRRGQRLAARALLLPVALGLCPLLVAALAQLPRASARADDDARPPAAQAAARDAPWTRLLERCVVPTRDGGSTSVDYGCFDTRRRELDAYLASLTAIERETFERWSRSERLAFLINAYNAFTIELILSAWPDLDSIRDLGGLFSSPWKQSFITLLGDRVSLDDIEHGMIRAPGRFDEPRIHFAVNCASIGCPALRREAFRGAVLDEQLEAQTVQFLGDRSRNRLRGAHLEVSPLFKWYREDFETGWRGITSLHAFLTRYADALGLSDDERSRLGAERLALRFLDYDWSLNDLPDAPP